MTRSRHISRALLMESLAALELAEATGQAVGVSVEDTEPFYVAYTPDLAHPGTYNHKTRTIRSKHPAGSPTTRATMEHELIHHLQSTKRWGLRRSLPGEGDPFSAAEWDRPHGARILEYYPNVVTDAEAVLREIQRDPDFDVRRFHAARLRPELPAALRERYRRDVLSEVARRLPRVRRNPNRQVAQKLDAMLPELESIRDDVDFTERVGRQALRSLVHQRRQHDEALAAKRREVDRLQAELRDYRQRLEYISSSQRARIRVLEAQVQRRDTELGRERMARAERDVQIAALEASLAAAKKKTHHRDATRVPLAAEASAEERRRREALMRKEAKKRR